MKPEHFGIASDLMQHCSMQNSAFEGGLVERSLSDFLQYHSDKYGTPAFLLASIASKLAHEGFLVWSGSGPGSPPLNARYFSGNVPVEEIQYKTFDFRAFGFTAVHHHFGNSVRFISVNDGEEKTNGSGFLLDGGLLVTAGHCVRDKSEVRIAGWENTKFRLRQIKTYRDKRLDLAILSFSINPFTACPGFRLRNGTITEVVMTMGYPPIPGFLPTLITEETEIAGRQTVAQGEIIGKGQSYLRGYDLLIVSARVKGGNSGGPAVARDGKVVGVITEMPAGPHGIPDPLIYGALIPSELLQQLINLPNEDPQVEILQFESTAEGFSTA